MSTFVRCVGCGEPLYGHPCRWCTCERCGNDLRDGYCFLCYSRNGDSFTYDSTPNSFDNPPDFSYLPPQPQYVPYSVVSLAWETISEIEHAFEDKQYQPEGILELFRKLHDDVKNIHEELAEYINTPSWNLPTIYCDDDDDDDYTIAITPDLPITDSLITEDEHLDTIPATESDELIKSSVEDLVHTPSESDGISESECDVPDYDNSQTINFSTFSNPLFDDSTSSDDESSHEEVIHEISFKTYSNPLFDLDEEIISSEFNPIHNEDLDSTLKNDRFNTESYLLESLLNHDTLMASSPKIDSLFDEFAGELITIPPRIVNREHEEYISLLERLVYDNSSPRPLEDFHANPNTIIESLPTFPIPVKDSDSLREEIDIFPGPDDSIPPGIESDDYDSEACALFVELKTKCACCVRGVLKQISAFYFFCASLESISAIEDTWEREEVWDDIQVVSGFLLGGKYGFLGKLAVWSPQVI
ncbi:hypothetical protein Tco_0250765 [Tanacetum coccineum]